MDISKDKQQDGEDPTLIFAIEGIGEADELETIRPIYGSKPFNQGIIAKELTAPLLKSYHADVEFEDWFEYRAGIESIDDIFEDLVCLEVLALQPKNLENCHYLEVVAVLRKKV